MIFSCEGLTVDCSECYVTEPDSADIIVHVTINSENQRVPLVIYKNRVDDNVIEYIDTAYSSPYYLYVELGEYYSVKAEYKSGSRTIFAIDGDKIRSRLVTETCELDCWVIADGIMDVKLKDN